MRSFRCTCGNLLFFHNSLCLACGSAVGWCPACRNVTPLLPDGPAAADPVCRCAWPACATLLRRCGNYADHDVCNRLVPAAAPPGSLCGCCRFNVTIPDLSVPGHRDKWYRLEVAKRRVLYDLDLLGLPYGQDARPVWPPLRFEFVADGGGSPGDPAGRAFTGHADGLITINIKEVDDLERERQRVLFQEAHRTLVGHFRHEIGHYYWDVLVRGRREPDCAAIFGDPYREPYDAALQRWYSQGPPSGWPNACVSAYAAMHPWEDFAETFATCLDMVSALDTAHHFGFLGPPPPLADLDALVARYADLGIAMNEINRSIGLLDLVPEVLVPAVVAKLRFVHGLIAERS